MEHTVPLFHLGPLEINWIVVTTWAIMLLLGVFS
jgi:hypothetical protein